MNGFTVIQANVQHSRAATASICHRLSQSRREIALIQEPWTCNNRVCGLSNLQGDTLFGVSPIRASRPRACIYIPKAIRAHPLLQFCTPDLTAVELLVDDNPLAYNCKLIIVSAYFPGDYNEVFPPEFVELLTHNVGAKIIIGCDSNAHHPLWGSEDTNRRGEILADFIHQRGLIINNVGNEATFLTSRASSVIDITLTSPNVHNNIHNWHISNEISMSDHRWICYEVDLSIACQIGYRNVKRTNTEMFKSLIAQCCTNLSVLGNCQSFEAFEKKAKDITEIIVACYEKSCSLRTPGLGGNTPWWSKEIEALRRKCRKFFNKARKSKAVTDWNNFQEARRDFKKKLRQAKRESWRKFCTEINSAKETSRLNKILAKTTAPSLGCIRREDGSLARSAEEVADTMLRAHFPGCVVGETKPLPIHHTPTETDWCTARRMITPHRTHMAVKNFAPYKSPGADGIHAALLQWGAEVLVTHLVDIFRGCIAHGRIPDPWREVKVIFIPKTGRDDHLSPRAFRPISLISILLKTLERICEKHIWRINLNTKCLHKNQHAYILGKSTDTALHQVVGKIENSILNKGTTLGLFIDIEGAFDKATFRSIDLALANHGVNNTIRRWISAMLRCRTVTLSIGNTSKKAQVAGGCPQGGVLSPLLWNLVINPLITSLNNSGFPTIGYADDIVTLIDGPSLHTLTELGNNALKIIENWCVENSLSVNADKTGLVVFTRKHNNTLPANISIFGKALTQTNSTKFLGITLDHKLNWNKHVDFRLKKAWIALNRCRRALGPTWGLSPRVTNWLYQSIVIPTLSHGAIVWWPIIKLDTTKKKLSKLQRSACLMITGAFRTTPTAAMEALLCLTPLDITIKWRAGMAFLRLWRGGQWCYENSRHGQIADVIQRELPSTAAPLDDGGKEVTHLRGPPNLRILESVGGEVDYESVISLYTDGSKNAGGSGAGIFSSTMNLAVKYPLGTEPTILQTECAALLIAAMEIQRNNLLNQTIIIFTDSKDLIKALLQQVTKSKLIKDCHTILTKITCNNKVIIQWRERKSDLGSVEADRLAREASKMQTQGAFPSIPLTLKSLLPNINEHILLAHKSRWNDTIGCRVAKNLLGNPSRALATKCFKMNKPKLRMLTGIITGHCRTSAHLHRMGLAKDPTCRGCLTEDETIEHILFHCPTISQLRSAILGEITPSEPIVGVTSPDQLLRFAMELGWLRE